MTSKLLEAAKIIKGVVVTDIFLQMILYEIMMYYKGIFIRGYQI
jgi:hypothetical protein